jgi:hypothetical protein
MLVSATITKIETEDNKKVFIEVLINSVEAILYNGENLIDYPEPHYINKNSKLAIDDAFINNNINFFKKVSEHQILGFIRKHDVIIINLDI